MKKEKIEIRFKNLPFLLNDMEKKEWIIDSFLFKYKKEQYIVILTLYGDKERKPGKYAKAKVEFVKNNNTNHSIKGYIDFYEVRFNNVKDFCDFFGVESGNAMRDLFKDFSQVFSDFIPKEKIISKSDTERKLIGSRAEGNNPNAVYCYDIRRNGRKTDGSPNERSIENSNKAQSLLPELYEQFFREKNLSFYFSDKKELGKSDDELRKAIASR
ncbi:DUF6037 family protein [Lysinibacillus parviboronicapiens]|uniref:DUF6037 family protein n=1 Tax=Lysinibacillus parviboronicapiens TaxID=436516 RepID=UPI001930FF15|nr:DUF6037 family protein [Lysinibacillus parviboronicapiens]